MSDIYVKKLNETYMMVDAEQGIMREISERFSYRTKDYKFNPKVQNRNLGWVFPYVGFENTNTIPWSSR